MYNSDASLSEWSFWYNEEYRKASHKESIMIPVGTTMRPGRILMVGEEVEEEEVVVVCCSGGQEAWGCVIY